MNTTVIICISLVCFALIVYFAIGLWTIKVTAISYAVASAFVNTIDDLFCSIFGGVFGVQRVPNPKPSRPTRKDKLFAFFLWPVMWYRIYQL